MPIPPPNRVPVNTEGMPALFIEGVTVASWGPEPDGKGPATQVHVLLEVRGLPAPLALRFKSAAGLDDFIEMLRTGPDPKLPGVIPVPRNVRYFRVPDGGPRPEDFGSVCFAGDLVTSQ